MAQLYQVFSSYADKKIMQKLSSEILINARQVTQSARGESYEFILNSELFVLECVKIESVVRGTICPIKNLEQTFEGWLFELNHVRVNPKIDNTLIIHSLMTALEDVGVSVLSPPSQDSIATCYKPLGEISDNVRFYLNQKRQLVFLSPSMKLRVIQGAKP